MRLSLVGNSYILPSLMFSVRDCYSNLWWLELRVISVDRLTIYVREWMNNSA
jgi:hypothetical protein